MAASLILGNMIEEKRKKQLDELKNMLDELLGSETFKLILFGSRARGDYSEESDLDVAVIVRGLTREMKNRILETIAEIELESLLPISAIVFSEDEFNHLKKRERRIAIDIDKEGLHL